MEGWEIILSKIFSIIKIKNWNQFKPTRLNYTNEIYDNDNNIDNSNNNEIDSY